MRIKECPQTWIPRIALLVLFIAIIACGVSSNVPEPTFDPNLLKTAVAGTYAVPQIQTLMASAPTNTQVPNMPEPTNTPNLTDTPLSQPTVSLTSQSPCTKMRFAEYLGPDDVDEMINEGVSFAGVSEIAVRFDCSTTTSNQIAWEWRRNGNSHCTNTFQSEECDQSRLTSWDSLPGKFLITLFSKEGYLGNLESGEYELIIYISGNEILHGNIEISE